MRVIALSTGAITLTQLGAITLTQLALSSFLAKASHPSPDGRGIPPPRRIR